MEPRKATHEGLKRHNRQMLLRAVYHGVAGSRAGLAQLTGLTKPTVSALVAELMDEGLLAEAGTGQASEYGGKRPRLLEFRPTARQIIGIGVDHRQINGVLTDLSGRVVAQQRLELDPSRPLELLAGAIDGLRAQLDAPLLCIGLGLPGDVEAATGRVRSSAALGWTDLAVAAPLQERYGVPVHLGHGTELAALAQYAFDSSNGAGGPDRLVTLLVERGVEVGVTLEGGSFHYGNDLSRLDFGGGGPGLTSILSEAGEDLLGLRYRAVKGDLAAARQIRGLAEALAPLVAWSLALLRPTRLTLSGPVTDLGDPLLAELRDALLRHLPDGAATAQLALAESRLSSALGAVALALQKEFDLI